MNFGVTLPSPTGLEIATDMVANATNIFSLATKTSGLGVVLGFKDRAFHY